MLKIGITGGIGSGKSTVSKIIESMGYEVFNSDVEAKKILNSNPQVKQDLVDLLGEEIYADNQLNRPLLAKLIFADDTLLSQVNAIVHPRVREAFNQLCENSANEMVFNEAAILIETGAHEQFDKMILVTAPKELRLSRVMQRDSASREEVESRMDKQWTDDRKLEFADVEIINDEKTPLLVQVENFIDQVISS